MPRYNQRRIEPLSAGQTKTTERSSATQPSRIKFSKRLLAVTLLFLIIIGGSLLLHYKFTKHDLNDVHFITERVSRHYLLPSNETPALATITDSKKVQSSFAGKVKNNDKILIYQTNKIAIVYRPELDRIVDVEPVSIDSPPSTSSQ